MKNIILLLSLFVSGISFAQSGASTQGNAQAPSGERALVDFNSLAQRVPVEPINQVAVTQNGRIKPFDTFARETILFLTGSYKKWGNHPVQTYMAIAGSDSAIYAPIIEVRSPELRLKLGYTTDKRFFSLADLENSNINSLAGPVFRKQEEGQKLNENEQKISETYGQMVVTQQIVTGEHWQRAINFDNINSKQTSHGNAENEAGQKTADLMTKVVKAIKEGDIASYENLAKDLVKQSRAQNVPELFTHYMETLDLEIFFNRAKLFFWSSIVSLLIGLFFVFDVTRKKISQTNGLILQSVPLLLISVGLVMRVSITRFAPVTNMYGTMIWVAFGVILFSGILFFLYKNWLVSGFMLIGSGLILMLTEQVPLVLSPDMDPIVAVLRSNFWLSTHVTTITISYAAFTIAMILGNISLIRLWTHKENENFFKEYSHYAYRMIQLGCFLLTVGIILGGVWADYSWGRFWGWDPKETWALIADLGFLVLLHARYIGWVNEFTLLAFSPLSYLLVVMAWYGVNFILAAGLHSYGFSSGGAIAVAVFVGLQLFIFAAAFLKYKINNKT